MGDDSKHTCDSECVHFCVDDTGKYDGYCDLLEKVIIMELEESCSHYGKEKTLKLW